MRSALLLGMGLLCGQLAFAHDVDAELSTRCSFELSDNVFARYSGGPFPYDRLTLEDYEPAFAYYLSLAKERIAAIKSDTSEPTFENTVEKIEFATEGMERVASVLSAMKAMNSVPGLQAIHERVIGRHNQFLNEISMDSDLSARVQKVVARGGRNRLTDEEKMLLKKMTDQLMVVPEDKKARLNQIEEELIALGENFTSNVAREMEEVFFEITDPAELAGLPQSAIDAAREEAKQKGKEQSWVFTLHAPSVLPVLQYSENRELRKKMYFAFNTRATQPPFDNRENILKFKALRQEKAEILGYPNFAEYQLRDRMAKNVATVNAFLDKMANAYREPAKKELAELEAFAGHKIERWDLGYYSNKLQEHRFGLDQSKLPPYFEFNNVLKGAFHAAHRLYGVEFVEVNVPVWHPSVKAFEVFNRMGESLGYYYFDAFPRKGKRPGAWSTDLLPGGLYHGVKERPHVVNVGNLTPPVKDGDPALLTLDNVRTIFHELGHGLHSLLSKAHYRSLFGANVAWDFVELPSQLNEKWMLEPEVLAIYARHYQTGEKLSDETIQKIKDSQNFGVAIARLEQTYKAQLDINWYTQPLNGRSVDEFEAELRKSYQTVPVEGILVSTAFLHIFPNSYPAGYYSYAWADVLVADAYQHFKDNMFTDPETGMSSIFNPAITWRYHAAIQEVGGTVHPEIAYARFKGSDPDPDALLRQQGILPDTKDKQHVTRRSLFRRILRRE